MVRPAPAPAPAPASAPAADRRFDALHAAHHGAVLRYFARRAGREQAPDLAAEVFLIAWRRIDVIPRDDALPWLYGVSRNVLANDRRARGRRDDLPRRLAHQRLEHGRDTATVVAERDLLRGALRALRDRDRELLMLIAWDGLTVEQAGRVLGCRTATAHVRLHRARQRLAEQLERASTVGAVGAVIVAVVVALAAVPLFGLSGGTGPDRADATTISALAERAAVVPAPPSPTPDRPYAYVHQRITGPTLVHLPSGRRAPGTYRQDVESWQRADGSGRRRTVRQPTTFADPRDAAAVSAVRPAARRPIVEDASVSARGDARRATNGIGRPIVLRSTEIAALPAESGALAGVLTRAAELATVTTDGPPGSRLGPARTVTDLAADLLSLPEVRPAVRAELVRILGRAPDVRARVGMRDPAGRSGTGLEWRSAEGHRTVLLVDAETTRVLGQRTSIPDAVVGVPTDGEPTPSIDVWTTIVGSGSVADPDDRPVPGGP